MAFNPNDDSVAFVAANGDAGGTATLLLSLADEHEIDRKSIIRTRGGFSVPHALAALLQNPAPPIAPTDQSPPDGWYETEMPTPDVEFDEAGRVVLTAEAVDTAIANGAVFVEDSPTDGEDDDASSPDREKVRAWAKERGLSVADRGALKKSILDAYAEAHLE